MDQQFGAVYSRKGCPSIPPEWAELSSDKHLSNREPQWGKIAATMWMSTSKQRDRWA
ncbi:hypothetical protein [Nitrosomonas sp. Nm58]|uniref:hypothetical protein n=1 Tax=Nitrosomonas sp. Nm58 TaxID=200126 RepID=UPI0015A5928C|nr:hypothetical protein [Nitrosomonas sp. Nm58]